MSDRNIDVGAYLDRLQLAGAAKPDLEFLDLLHRRHQLTVPFENFDIERGVGITLELPFVLSKIVTRRRGGFCYELNGAFCWLLRESGYEVDMVNAPARNADGEWCRDFDHMALVVKTEDGPWLADVGFGGPGIRKPIPLVAGREHRQVSGDFQLTRDGEWWVLERYDRTAIRYEPLYRFDLQGRELADFSEMCTYHQTDPESPLNGRVICTAAMPDGRITLGENGVVMERGGRKSEEAFAGEDGRAKALERYFGLNLDS